ncbi:hypothetical protein WQ57_01485 [Mesobacillus campisalis]|uniref:Uncharacterized protein n=1 Tax=Mesobacillus campisalis TaxID=1408103 RepID=A0A0M2T3Y8_9BACI|nr:hypothetical protein [Mesobacillus campisalis]KKK39972.1 hypothetical protein WQ57_01485 [Mesobacillus campisalis]
MPKVVIGSILSVIAYIILFILAEEFAGSSLIIPVEFLYLFLIYAVGGCLLFVFVLPILIIIGEFKGKKNKNHPINHEI